MSVSGETSNFPCLFQGKRLFPFEGSFLRSNHIIVFPPFTFHPKLKNLKKTSTHMESGSGGVVGESSRELLGSAMIDGARQPSWRLNLDEFRLPERESDHRHQTFNIRRLIRHKSMCVVPPHLFALCVRVCARRMPIFYA